MDRHTQIWLGHQPIWHDRDMIIIAVVGVTVGFVAGIVALRIFC